MKPNPSARILEALSTYTNRSGAQLIELTRLSSGSLYPALAALERQGKIEGFWEGTAYPRRRLYRLKETPCLMT